MSKDTIYRQAAIEALAKEMPSLTTPDGTGQFDHDIQIADEAFVDAMQILNDLPSVQPERTKGKWIHDGYDFPHGNDWIHCSICGKKGTNVPADLTNFCPNCGADMRGDELDETD